MPYKDKEKQRLAQAEHYQKNKELYQARQKARLNKARDYVNDIKKASKCVDCGEDNWKCLDFDHVDPKKKTKGISKMVRSRFSTERIQKEIDKCEIRCSNCHRIRTYDEMHWE
jgi:hypothetical protein